MFGTVLTSLSANILIRFSKDKKSSKAMNNKYMSLPDNKDRSIGEVYTKKITAMNSI